MAPRGRPPANHEFDASEGWVHKETRARLDAEAHAALVLAKKSACLRAYYWERGGRQKRLARYVRKRKPKPVQLTLDSAFAHVAHCTLRLRGCSGEISEPVTPEEDELVFRNSPLDLRGKTHVSKQQSNLREAFNRSAVDGP